MLAQRTGKAEARIRLLPLCDRRWESGIISLDPHTLHSTCVERRAAGDRAHILICHHLMPASRHMQASIGRARLSGDPILPIAPDCLTAFGEKGLGLVPLDRHAPRYYLETRRCESISIASCIWESIGSLNGWPWIQPLIRLSNFRDDRHLALSM